MADVFAETADLPALPFVCRQFLSGPHENFHYLVGDAEAGAAALVDPAFHVDALFEAARQQGLRVQDAFFTHAHWDHIGGIPRIVELGVDRVYIHEAARHHPKVEEALDMGAEVGLAADGDTVMVGDLPVRFLHTPGHQPESSCLLAGAPNGPQALFGGDTLFIASCGRTDFPGGDTDAMFAAMARLRGFASDDVHLMPGHHYAEKATMPLSQAVVTNRALATKDRADFGRLPFLRG